MEIIPEVLPDTLPGYERWDIFKKEAELKLGHYVDTNLWLQAKPKKPLPWSNSDLQKTVLYIKKSRTVLKPVAP